MKKIHVLSLDELKYFILFTNNFKKYFWIFFMQKKRKKIKDIKPIQIISYYD